MTSSPAPGPRWAAVTSAVGIAVAAGFPGLPVAFFVSYAFRDVVEPGQHLVFLTLALALALLSTLVAWPVLALAHRYGAVRGLVGAAGVVLAAYGAALGLGTVVSLLAADAGSVTADQPPWPFLALVAGCVLAVVLGARAARAALAARAS